MTRTTAVLAMRLRVPGRALAAALVMAAMLLPAAPPAVRAADPTFGTPATDIVYGESITFTVPISAAAPTEGVELRLRFPDSLGPFITPVPVAGTGNQTLRYRMDLTGSGHMVPNTTFEATWAAVLEPGTQPVLSAPQTIRYADTDHDWRTLRGDLVIVHWYDGSDTFAKRALAIGDKAVRDTAKLLGVTETDPIDFFIYGDNGSFRTALGPGTRENVGGQAHSDIRTLFALIPPEGINDPWVGVVIPHELVHLVFDTAVRNPYRFPPRWFNEGLAVYLSEGYTQSDRSLVEQAVAQQDLLPLTALTGQFPTEPDKTYLAYAESVSAIDHLVRTDGQPALLALIAGYKDGLTDDEAFSRALGRDLAAFQDGWLSELGAKPPQQFGPAPYLPGPMPPGWDVPAGPGASPGSSPAAATAGPSATGGVSTDGSGGGSDRLVLLAVIGMLVVVVIGALVVARRRGSTT